DYYCQVCDMRSDQPLF
nr:immunoglobulin light chain junction region [Macaca mulatta]